MSHEMQELADGVEFWHGRRWPADFHNSEYVSWAKQNPGGDFTLDWWHQFRRSCVLGRQRDRSAALT